MHHTASATWQTPGAASTRSAPIKAKAALVTAKSGTETEPPGRTRSTEAICGSVNSILM